MRAPTALEVVPKLEGGPKILEGFERGVIKVLGSVTAEVEMDGRKPKSLEFIVVPDAAQGFSALLGRPFAEAKDISFTRLGEELTFANVDPRLFENSSSRVQMRALEEYRIEPEKSTS
ncbi:hypothetical protein QAD02_000884 [Eretmocerus hayati]|uniref:Uncharacterized protein n=1 Tax=Eretmocerus hayati TaxID=131215 RepID=A0ACC2NEJ5_9HYME|nr:hypothetical protein QAD02_000884 [Eretmocerus hayati]